MPAPEKPSLDGLEEKWSARWWALLMLALGTALGIFSTMITTLLQGKK